MVSVSLVFLVLLSISWALANDRDYCRFTSSHTLCRWQSVWTWQQQTETFITLLNHVVDRYQGVGPACGQVGERGLSVQEQEEVTDIHNRWQITRSPSITIINNPLFFRLRSGVAQGLTNQPSASNMRVLVWDHELARVAQRLADQCTFDHDCSDCRKVPRFSAGQNLYQSYSTGKEGTDWQGAAKSWYDEIDLFHSSIVSSYQFSSSTGHYTQLVWATTDRLGCGVTQFRSGGWNTRLYVCNYGEAGNFIGKPVYSQGSSCSSCPSSSSCSTVYPGLCSSSSEHNSSSSEHNLPLRPVSISTPRPYIPPQYVAKPDYTDDTYNSFFYHNYYY